MIQPTYTSLQKLFADRVFHIPRYQRFYSWKKQQREHLFEDIETLHLRQDSRDHFMATIVCYKTPEITEVGSKEYRLYDIVDGQQRLTTLIIILKCIEMEIDDAEEKKELARVIVKKDGNLILLQTNNANDRIFNAFLRTGKTPSKDNVTTRADQNLQSGIKQCGVFVKRWKAEKGDVMSLLKLVTNRLGFIIFDTEDRQAVYSVFEVLNSRGLAVDWLDKCKSTLMECAYNQRASEQAADDAINSLQKIWGEIYREIAKENVSGDEILRVAGTLQFGDHRGKPRPADMSLESFRSACDTADKPRQLAEYILDVAKKLVGLEADIFYGPVTNVLHARILAVAILSADCLTPEEREKVMNQWERVTFRIFSLYGKDSRFEVGTYVRLAAGITRREPEADRYSKIMVKLRELGKGYPIKEAVKSGLSNCDCYSEPEFVRYVLWKYEEHLNSAGTVDQHVRQKIWGMRATDSIEHIFPQNPKKGGPWDGKMASEDGGDIGDEGQELVVSAEVDRIGNLVLLPLKINIGASRKGFQDKKAAYEEHNVRMLKEILDAGDWNFQSIVEREKRLMAWAETQWDDVSD